MRVKNADHNLILCSKLKCVLNKDCLNLFAAPLSSKFSEACKMEQDFSCELTVSATALQL